MTLVSLCQNQVVGRATLPSIGTEEEFVLSLLLPVAAGIHSLACGCVTQDSACVVTLPSLLRQVSLGIPLIRRHVIAFIAHLDNAISASLKVFSLITSTKLFYEI